MIQAILNIAWQERYNIRYAILCNIKFLEKKERLTTSQIRSYDRLE